MKKKLSVLLSFALLFSMVQLPAFSADTESDDVAIATDQQEEKELTNIPGHSEKAELLSSDEVPQYTPQVQIISPEQPWDCRQSEMLDYDINQVGRQYEAAYDQMVEESKKIDQFIVRFKDGSNASTLQAITSIETFETGNLVIGTDQYTVITVNGRVNSEEYMTSVSDAVLFIQPDYELEICATDQVTQEIYSDESDIIDLAANRAHENMVPNLIDSENNISIALLDTGIDVAHPDLTGHFVDGWNFINNSSAVEASGKSFGEAHGTHLAGIIVNTFPDALIMPLQVFEYGKAHTSDVISAIQYAEAHDAKIVNCSWGLDRNNPLLLSVMQNSEMVFVAAAGNNCENIAAHPFYPASFSLENVVSVTSIDENGSMSYFSNYGTSIDYAAKGSDILSTTPGGNYAKMSGTSISAGIVAATLAKQLSEGNLGTSIESTLVVSAQNLVNNWAENPKGFTDIAPEDLSASASFSLSLKEDGTVWAWGANDFGQCGVLPSDGLPVQLPGLKNIREIATGWTHGMAIDSGSNLWTWGSNIYGELGDGTTISRRVPMKVMGAPQMKTIEAPALDNTSVAIGYGGTTLWYWGKAKSTVSYIPQSLEVPKVASVPVKVTKIVYAYGGHDDCFYGIDNNANVWRWNILEDGSISPSLETIPDIGLASDIAVGINFVVIFANSDIWGKGENTFGQFGDGTYNSREHFELINSSFLTGNIFHNLESVSTTCTSIIVKQENSILVAGDNSFCKNYVEFKGSMEEPARFHSFEGPKEASAICGGVGYTIFVGPVSTYDNTMVEKAMGGNERGYLGVKKDVIKEEIYPLSVGGTQYPKAFDADRVLITNVPVFADIAEVIGDVSQLLPTTLNVYAEDEITSFAFACEWTQRRANYTSVTPDGLLQAHVYGMWPDLDWVDTPARIKVFPEIIVEAYPEELISMSELDELVLSYGPSQTVFRSRLPQSLSATVSISGDIDIPINWNYELSDLEWEYQAPRLYLKDGAYTISGELGILEESFIIDEPLPTLQLQIIVGTHQITEVGPISPIHVPYNVSSEELLEILPSTATVSLSCNVKREIPVSWNIENFNNVLVDNEQNITGTLALRTYMENPDNLSASVTLTIDPCPDPDPIVFVNNKEITVPQNYYLAPMAPNIAIEGEPVSSEALPETVTVRLTGEKTAEVSVEWNVAGFDPMQTGTRQFSGRLVGLSEAGLANPDNLPAKLIVNVEPQTYQVSQTTQVNNHIEVLPGTTIAQLNQQVQSEKEMFFVVGHNASSNRDIRTLCPVTFTEEDNLSFPKDIPGTYTLTARLPDNFLNSDGSVKTVSCVVTVVGPQEIVSAESTHMDAYQSVASQYLEDIPSQVNVTLENDMVVPVDVEWNWADYDKNAKDTISNNHLIPGHLVNLPSIAVQPEGEEIIPILIVSTIPVNYEITALESENLFDADAGLTLEEITAILKPELTFEITSTTEGITLTTSYTTSVSLETAKNPGFTPNVADVYPLTGTLALPSNITCPENESGDSYDAILLNTNPVDVESVEPVYATASEGTPFNELTLPTQVVVTLSSVGVDGNLRKITTGVDWGTGEGYTAFPEGLTDDTPVTMEITGQLDNYPDYVNGYGEEVTLYITMTRVYDLIAISPARIPDIGSMKVNLGSSLSEIYEQIENHAVELTLQSRNGETSTATVTFELREGDNTDYDPLTLGTYTLTGYLPLADNIENPDNLGVEIVVQTMKYTISSTKVPRITGVISGTAFEDIEMPELVTIVRNDKVEEDLPVTWNGSNYNPTKLGSQVIRGTLVTPLPIHIENPNKRQPNAIVTVVNPDAQILSLQQIPREGMMLLAAEEDVPADDNSIPGFTEYRYLAEVLYEDGRVETELISVFVENEGR